jgi:signal transduction histidine kinase
MSEIVLVIDDDDIVRRVIRSSLECFEYSVIEATGAMEGIEVFRKESPDLILCDLQMPEVDGFEVLSVVTRESPDTPVVIVSGAGEITAAVKAIQSGAWNYILKPIVDIDILKHVVEKALEWTRLIKENRNYKKNLEKRNEELKESLERLRKTQDRLIQSEKMRALFGLVSGIAHEINTPIGVVVTANSHLLTKALDLKEQYEAEEPTFPQMENCIESIIEASTIIERNLNRAAELVKSFKNVSVENIGTEKRSMNLKESIDNLLLTMKSKFQGTKHQCVIDCPDDINIVSYPDAFYQIFTNLIINSLIHAFADKDEGTIKISVTLDDSNLVVKYSDDGKGMENETLKKLYEPFFTTKRDPRGSGGLGMHIVYNCVTQRLGGSISCESSVSRGTIHTMVIPSESLK